MDTLDAKKWIITWATEFLSKRWNLPEEDLEIYLFVQTIIDDLMVVNLEIDELERTSWYHGQGRHTHAYKEEMERHLLLYKREKS